MALGADVFGHLGFEDLLQCREHDPTHELGRIDERLLRRGGQGRSVLPGHRLLLGSRL